MSAQQNGKSLDRLPDPAQRGLIGIREAAPFLGFSYAQLYKAVRRGDVPSLRFGSRYQIPTAWIADVIAGRVSTPARAAS